jgi:hypothetical protein
MINECNGMDMDGNCTIPAFAWRTEEKHEITQSG